MLDLSFEFDETLLGRIRQRLGDAPERVNEGVREIAVFLKKTMRANTPVGIEKKSASERAKNKWQAPVPIGKGAYVIRNTAPYAITLDRGYYPGVGPRTMRAKDLMDGHAGIYSKQAPGGMFGLGVAAMNLDKMLDSILDRVEESFNE